MTPSLSRSRQMLVYVLFLLTPGSKFFLMSCLETGRTRENSDSSRLRKVLEGPVVLSEPQIFQVILH